MTILNATRTTQDADGYTAEDFRTEDQWLGEVKAHKSKRKELVRLWFVNKFGSQSKLAKHLDCGTSTVQRHVEMLLKTGELTEEHYQKKMGNSRKPEQNGPKRAEPVENSTPRITLKTFHPLTDDSISNRVQLLNTAESIEPTVCYVQPIVGTDMGSDQDVVSMGTEAERDLATVYSLFDEIGRITGKYLFGGWSQGDWNGIGGECRTIEFDCNTHSADLRERLKQQSQAVADSFTFNAKGAPSLCESNSDNDD